MTGLNNIYTDLRGLRIPEERLITLLDLLGTTEDSVRAAFPCVDLPGFFVEILTSAVRYKEWLE